MPSRTSRDVTGDSRIPAGASPSEYLPGNLRATLADLPVADKYEAKIWRQVVVILLVLAATAIAAYVMIHQLTLAVADFHIDPNAETLEVPMRQFAQAFPVVPLIATEVGIITTVCILQSLQYDVRHNDEYKKLSAGLRVFPGIARVVRAAAEATRKGAVSNEEMEALDRLYRQAYDEAEQDAQIARQKRTARREQERDDSVAAHLDRWRRKLALEPKDE